MNRLVKSSNGFQATKDCIGFPNVNKGARIISNLYLGNHSTAVDDPSLCCLSRGDFEEGRGHHVPIHEVVVKELRLGFLNKNCCLLLH